MIKHNSPISSVASYGNYIATAGYDNKVILWEKKTKQFINRGCHDHLANYVTFSPSGNYLLSTSSDYTARLWSLPEMKLTAVLSNHDDDVESASFSNCGNYIATASRDHQVRIFNIKGELIKVFSGHTADVLSVVWSSDDTELVSSGDDGTIRIWNVRDGSENALFNFNGVETDTCDMYNAFVYAGNDLGEINMIDTKRGKLSGVTKAHGAGIKSIKINQHLHLLVSSSYDRTVKLWRIESGTGVLDLYKEIFSPPSIWLRAVNIIDEKLMAFGTFGSCYALYSLETEEWNFTNVEDTDGKNAVLAVGKDIYAVGDAGDIFFNDKIVAKTKSLCNFLLSVDGMIVTGGQTGELFDAKTGNVIYQHYSPINCGTTYMSNGKKFAIIGTYTGEGIVFISENGGLKYETTVKLHSNAVKGLASNGNVIFSVCANTDAAFHDASTLNLIKYIKHAHDLIANGTDWVANDTFVSVSRDKKLRIWDLNDRCEIIVSPHTHSIKCVKVSAIDNFLIATGSYSGVIAIYNSKINEWIYTKKVSTSGISSISFSIEENCFLFSSYDGNVNKINCLL